MGIYDREYTHDGYGQGGRAVQFVRPTLPPVVKWLLIINIAVFFVSALIPPIGKFVYAWGSVLPDGWAAAQVWRLVTYQFLHDLNGFFHILFNMMVLYFFGPLMERLWGSRRFLKFFLSAGAAGGVVYTLLVLVGLIQHPLPMVGASGGLYGLLGAVAILFPHMRVFLFGILPMSMRGLAILLVIMSLLRMAGGHNVGGEAAHLTGLVIGVLYVIYQPMLTQLRMEKKKGQWSEKIETERSFELEVDRVLDKIHKQGLTSLTSKEKDILREATRREQEQLR